MGKQKTKNFVTERYSNLQQPIADLEDFGSLLDGSFSKLFADITLEDFAELLKDDEWIK